MKTSILIFSLAMATLAVNAQSTHLKNHTKKPAGTVRPGFTYQTVNGQHTLKSTVVNQGTPYRTLHFSPAGDDSPSLVIRKDNRPVYIEKQLPALKQASAIAPEERFFSFMEAHHAITGISNPRELYRITGTHTDRLGITHIRTIQQYKGIPVHGSEAVMHLNNQKERLTGQIPLIDSDLASKPGVNDLQCLEYVKKHLAKHTTVRELTAAEKKLFDYNAPQCSPVYYNNGSGYTLAWEVSVRPNFREEWKYFVNALNGDILHFYNNTKTDGPATGTGNDLNNQPRTFDIFLEDGIYYLMNSAEDMYNSTTGEGVILTLDANNTSTDDLDFKYVTSNTITFNQQAAISAHVHATLTYDYLLNTFGRNSVNGSGGDILSLVNVAEDDGSSMENAFWNGKAVFYGNGGPHFKPLAGALDVSAHELGHGVVSYTANLQYYGQSGAINESYADIFGSMVDRNDWTIGEDVVNIAYYPSGALRNMADPHNGGDQNDHYWQPSHVSEMYLGTQDNAGVHINNGIGNRLYYLYATATSKEIAEQVFYRALTEYMTSTSQFIDWRIAVIQAATDLYGGSSQEVAEAGKAFTAVGIQEEEEVEDEPVYDTNPGQDYLLSYNTDIGYTGTLYRTTTAGGSFAKLTNTTMKRNVSVVDDGSVAFFVTEDDSIKKVSLDPSDPFERIVSPDAFWDNVAISKDGRRLAGISVEVDTAIYVYDFDSQRWRKFRLYNPTTSHTGSDAGGVLYADAIEFDITGEYLIYDAANVISSDFEEEIYYWDIGFIKVWDNDADDFGDGSISKLFSSLPKNVSVGNPVFSKNSPFIIAFDYMYDDETMASDEEFAVYGANLETNKLKQISYNETWGYPSFSKNDDRIAFTSVSAFGEDQVAVVDLEADKITPAGTKAELIAGSIWPVYYATGERDLGLPPVANFTVDTKNGNAPLVVKFVDMSTHNPTAWQWTFEGGSPAVSLEQHPEVTYNTNGTYTVTLTAANSNGNGSITKTAYITVSDATGIETPATASPLFYPNPARNQVSINCGSDFTVRLYNLQGQTVLTGINQKVLDLSAIDPGVYLLELNTRNAVTRHKLIRE